MKRKCEECGVDLSFRTERFFNNRYLCPNCLDNVDPTRKPAPSAVYSKELVSASLGARLGGQFVDGLIAACPIYGGVIISAATSSGLAGYVTGLLGLLVGISYYLLADALPGGQSIGKRLAGTKVVDATSGEPCNVGQSIGRNLLGLLGFLDWLFIFGEMRQRLGDKAANTIVVWK